MGSIGAKMQARIQAYAQKGLSMESYNFKPEWQLRIKIAEQLFQAYASNRVPMTRPPRKILPQIANIIYRQLLNSSDPKDKLICEVCCIRQDEGGKVIPRSYNEITNDIACYEILRSVWGVDTSNHAKATCEEGAYQLIEMGINHSDPRALASGIDKLSKLHNDFAQDEQDYSRTAETDIDIISDVTLIRPDATQLSREAIEAIKRKYGAYIDEKKGGINALLAPSDDVPTPTSQDDDDDDEDFFEATERDILFNKDNNP